MDVALERWDPISDMMSLRDAMDRLLRESFVVPNTGLLGSGRQSLPLDAVENADSYVVSASMPGVKPEDVQVTVQGNTLTIRGESTIEQTQTPQQQGQEAQGKRGNNWILHERRHGSFFRSISLPTPVNADGATTKFEHGELIITLPKSEEAKPKQIRVEGSQGQIG
jgi:HSP20 family protein